MRGASALTLAIVLMGFAGAACQTGGGPIAPQYGAGTVKFRNVRIRPL
jgi:hypothetical protein